MPLTFPGSRKSRIKELLRSGDAANRRRFWPAAETAYRAALALDASLKHIWVQYGHALKEQGHFSAAEQAYRHSLALDAAVADCHLQLGHVLKLQGQMDDAVDAYVTAYRLDPDLPGLSIELRALGLDMPPVPAGRSGSTANPEFIDAVYGTSPAPAAAGLPNGHAADAGTGADRRYVSPEHALSAHGLAPHVVDIFDFRYYFYANPLVQDAVGEINQHRCLLHFCAHGVSNVLQCNADLLFDTTFYCAAYLPARLSAGNAYWHWLNVGFGKGWHPNRGNWIKGHLGSDVAAPEGFDFELCKAFFYDNDTDEKGADLFGRFIDADVLRAGPHLPVTPETADFFVAIADRFARGDPGSSGRAKRRSAKRRARNDNAAARLYERVLLSVPHHRRALLSYADILRRKRLFLQAAAIYSGIIERDQPSVGCFVHQAACYQKLGDLRKALTCLHAGLSRFPGEFRLQKRFDSLADKFITSEWPIAMAIGKLSRYAEAQARMREACEFVLSKMTVTQLRPDRPIRSLAIVGNLDAHQCYFYRIEQKIEHLGAAGYNVSVYNFHDQLNDFGSDIYKYEAVIFYRVTATAPVLGAITKSKEMGLITFYDIDDLIFVEVDYPGTFESFLGQITLEEYVGLKLCVPMYRLAISLCDYAIAPTTALASEMAKIVSSGRAFVHRNGFGYKHERFSVNLPAVRANERVTIFYGSGTLSHKEDFRDHVEPALVEIVKRHGKLVHIVLVGAIVMSDALESIRRNLTILDTTWNIDEYWSILRTVDINIAVLKQTPMTDCKSEIKWLESAMFGIPSVVSGTSTYREVVEDGVTGLICDTPEEWVAALDLLVRDSELRRRIGLAAWHRVRDVYNVRRMTENLTSILNRVAPPLIPSAKSRIVIVNTFYAPQGVGGATRIVDDNVRYLSEMYKDEFRIDVFTSGWGTDYATCCYVRDGVRVTSVLRPAVSDAELGVVDEGMEKLFAEYLDQIDPALVHFHCVQRLTSSVVSAALARGIPYLITPHDGWWISDEQFIVNEVDERVLYDYADPLATALKWGAPAYQRMMRLKNPLFGARKILPVSEKFADVYRRCGVPNVVAVENGIADIHQRDRTASPDGRVRLGFFGGRDRVKGFDIMKYALLSRKFAHLRLMIIDTELEPGSSRREVWNTTPIEFVPKFPEDQVAELYANIDVLLAPSVCVESFGLVTREALHCGCWVVASDRGSIGDCVSDGENGYVIDVADATELIRVLALIDGTPQRYLQAPSVRPVLRRSSEQGDELAALYKSIIASHSPIAADASGALDRRAT